MSTSKRRKSWSDEKLLARALAAKTGKAYWDNVRELSRRASASLFERCAALTKSEFWAERCAGVDVLAQLYRETKKSRLRVMYPYRKEILALFLKMLAVEKNEDVTESLLYGIGFNSHSYYRGRKEPSKSVCYLKGKDIDAILPFARSDVDDIRRGAVAALSGVDSMKAIRGLIRLSEDRRSHIRDWATFAIGELSDLDNDEIRRALYARCTDRHHDTRMEAISGLARRKDNGVKKYLEKEFSEYSLQAYR